MTKQAQTRLMTILPKHGPKRDTVAPYVATSVLLDGVDFDWRAIEDCPVELAAELFYELNRLVDYSKLMVQSSTGVARRGKGHNPTTEN